MYTHRYCVSHIDEPGASDIHCVQEQEKNIQRWQEKIGSKLEALGLLMREYNSLCSPVASQLIRHAERLVNLIAQSCSLAIDTCELMKKWTNSDKTYPKRLWDEIISTNVNRGKALEEIKKLTRKRVDIVHLITRRQQAQDKILNNVQHTKIEVNKINTRQDTVKHKIEIAEHQLEIKNSERDDVDNQIQNRRSNSPKYFDMLWQKWTDLKSEVEKIEENLKVINKHLSRSQKEESSLYLKLDKLQEELNIHDQALSTAKTRLKDINIELKQSKKNLAFMEQTTATAKYIRELKISPTAFMVMHRNIAAPFQNGRFFIRFFNLTYDMGFVFC